nr:transposase [Corynebacterium belfantii]
MIRKVPAVVVLLCTGTRLTTGYRYTTLADVTEDFRTRPLDTGPYLYVSCDALTMKVRESGRVVKTSVLLATGINVEGYRELLGMQIAPSESVASWTRFFRDLQARGLDEVYLVTSDAHLGIQHAISEILPNASWQRCRTHFAKNLSGMVPKTQWPTLSAMFHTIFQTRLGIGVVPST